jgi:hypothetical protein
MPSVSVPILFKSKKARGKQKTCYSIYISSFIPIIFLIRRSWFRFEGPQNCVSPICSHSDNHRSRITSGLPCQLWLIRFHHRTRINLSHHSSSFSAFCPFVHKPLSHFLLPRSVAQGTTLPNQRSRQKSREIPEKPHKDGASANPIENYLLCFFLITSFSHNRIEKLE